ncbi:MAG: hypothetical protein RL722_1417 [Pseudomonadota bacterium]|jgi:two-component system response regulator PilR (NtrC family)
MSSSPDRPRLPARTPSARVLVVDDEPDLLTVYELALVREGYDVHTAASVQEASATLAGQGYDAVITDLRLPDGSGIDLLRRLEQAGRPERVIVITAYGSPETAVQALKSGAYDYLTKPVDLRQFRNVVASALGRRPANDAGFPASAARRTLADDAPAVEPLALRPARADAGLATTPAPAGSPAEPAALRRMVGRSAAMQQVRALVLKVARSMAPVLLQGESGTGKEVVARAIHEAGVRAEGPFVPVNCGAIPEHLLEAEFFGYRKGAFTGAQEDRPGFFQAARGGTLFLDEIGDLPLAMQSKLLRAVQERAVRPLGSTTEQPVDVRLVSATHRLLGNEVMAGRFRQDLYYRLNVIEIRVPALRERMEDLPLLCEALVARLASDSGLAVAPQVTPAALARLLEHDFAGNVRELENLLHRAMAFSDGAHIDVADLGLPPLGPAAAGWDEDLAPDASLPRLPLVPDIELPLDDPPLTLLPVPAQALVARGALPASRPMATEAVVPAATEAAVPDGLPHDLMAHLDEVERRVLVAALEKHRYNRTAAGASLGLTLRQMRYRMARLGIQPGGGDNLTLPGDDADLGSP